MTSSQRWRDRRSSFRPADDKFFDPSAHSVVWLPDNAVVGPFVATHHYSGTVPNSVNHRYALIDNRTHAIVGAALFGSPNGPQVISSSFPFLDRETRSVTATELQRLVLLDHVETNGESWFVRQCMGLDGQRLRQRYRYHENSLHRQGVEAVVSFSDPWPRHDEHGVLTMPGHVGVVYQSLSAWWTGMSKARNAWYRSDGNPINERDFTKIRASCGCCGSGKSTSGVETAIKRFVAWGARTPRRNECRKQWLAEVRDQIATKKRHGGNHRYCWGLTSAARSGIEQKNGPVDAKKYPKKNAA
jgi:hypothetical protein